MYSSPFPILVAVWKWWHSFVTRTFPRWLLFHALVFTGLSYCVLCFPAASMVSCWLPWSCLCICKLCLHLKSLHFSHVQSAICLLWSQNDTELIHSAETGIKSSRILSQPFWLFLAIILQPLFKRIEGDVKAVCERRALYNGRKQEMGQENILKKQRSKSFHLFCSLSLLYFIFWHHWRLWKFMCDLDTLL